MASGIGRSSSAWTEEALIALLLNIMRQTNPTLSATGWKNVTKEMASFGFNQNVLQKKWVAIRSQFAANNDLEQTATSPAAPTSTPKRKHIKHDNANDSTPVKKARTKAASKASIDAGTPVDEPTDDKEDEII